MRGDQNNVTVGARLSPRASLAGTVRGSTCVCFQPAHSSPRHDFFTNLEDRDRPVMSPRTRTRKSLLLRPSPQPIL